MNRIQASAGMLATLLAAVAVPAAAAPSYDSCTGFVTSLPAVISTQGTWCLDGDLATGSASGAAVNIAANNVVLDCNGFKIGGQAAGPATSANGVMAQANNVTVRGCTIRGFAIGVALIGNGHVVEDNRLDRNTVVAVSASGVGNTIRRNIATNTGLSPFVPLAYGIVASGPADIIDNTIDGVAVQGAGTGAGGIATHTAPGSTIRGNRVRGLGMSGGTRVGISVGDGSAGVAIVDNVLHGDIASHVGIACSDSSPSSVRGNIVSGFLQNEEGCTDAGGNYWAPTPE